MDALKIPKANVVRISGLFNKSNIESKKKKKKKTTLDTDFSIVL